VLSLILEGFKRRAKYSLSSQKVPPFLCHLETFRKNCRIFSYFAAFILFLALRLPDAEAQSHSLRLSKISYLTANLDSTLKAFLGSGFVFGRTEYHPFGPFVVMLPAGHQIELSGSDITDSTKAATRTLAKFGNHLARVELEARDIQSIAHTLDSAGIPHNAISANAFSLAGTSPLEISFCEPASKTVAAQMENRYSRISWLVLTASDSAQVMMRKVFGALGLKQFHEGCCDYWLVGPVESRTAIRFELPAGSKWASPPPKQHPEPDWLSIEEGGVVYAY
jgi:hypothetical protein